MPDVVSQATSPPITTRPLLQDTFPLKDSYQKGVISQSENLSLKFEQIDKEWTNLPPRHPPPPPLPFNEDKERSEEVEADGWGRLSDETEKGCTSKTKAMVHKRLQ